MPHLYEPLPSGNELRHLGIENHVKLDYIGAVGHTVRVELPYRSPCAVFHHGQTLFALGQGQQLIPSLARNFGSQELPGAPGPVAYPPGGPLSEAEFLALPLQDQQLYVAQFGASASGAYQPGFWTYANDENLGVYTAIGVRGEYRQGQFVMSQIVWCFDTRIGTTGDSTAPVDAVLIACAARATFDITWEGAE